MSKERKITTIYAVDRDGDVHGRDTVETKRQFRFSDYRSDAFGYRIRIDKSELGRNIFLSKEDAIAAFISSCKGKIEEMKEEIAEQRRLIEKVQNGE